MYISVTTSSGCAAFFQQASSGPDRCISIAAYSGTTAAAQLPSSSPAPPAVVQPFSSRLTAVQPGVFLLQPTVVLQRLLSSCPAPPAVMQLFPAAAQPCSFLSQPPAVIQPFSAVPQQLPLQGFFSSPSAHLSALKRTYSVNAVAQR